jgi:hypothetical protein
MILFKKLFTMPANHNHSFLFDTVLNIPKSAEEIRNDHHRPAIVAEQVFTRPSENKFDLDFFRKLVGAKTDRDDS